jgi:hypothetical protein
LLDNENWMLWEQVIVMIEELNNSKSLDS